MPTRILTRVDVARLCTMEMALDAVEGAFAAHGRGETRMPVKVYQPGAHVNAIGADAPGKQELETELMVAARVFVDDMEQASESGEVNVPLHTGAMTRAQVAGTLGQVVAGALAARPGGAETITVFDSTGLAVQDLAPARVRYGAAVAQGAGEDIALVD